MPERSDTRELSRRTVLRTGAIASGTAVLGSSAVGTVTARGRDDGEAERAYVTMAVDEGDWLYTDESVAERDVGCRNEPRRRATVHPAVAGGRAERRRGLAFLPGDRTSDGVYVVVSVSECESGLTAVGIEPLRAHRSGPGTARTP